MEEQNNPKELIQALKFCVFDLETTGGNHKTDKIIEIGLVRVENLKITAQKNFLIQPEIKIPEFIQKLTTITPNDVKLSPIIEDVVDEILEFMGDSVLVAHNISFDVPFFNSVLKRLGREELKNPGLCTNLMTKYLIPNLMNTNLTTMSQIFNIAHDKAHRALDDAIATAHLLINYLKIFIDKDVQKVNHLYYPRNRYELDRMNFRQGTNLVQVQKKLSKLKSSSLVTVKGENGVILFAMPLLSHSEGNGLDHQFFMEKCNQLNWELITVRILGPFVEALIHYTTLFNKLESSEKFEITDFLWKTHLSTLKRPEHQPNDETLKSDQAPPLGDFLIAHHLVPEQLVIYPTLTLEPKSAMVFRYPGHQKKLLQFINSKSHRLENQKLKPAHIHQLLKDFIDQYLQHEKEQGNLFFFNKKLPKSQPNQFLNELDHFLSRCPNPYSYPRDYV
jgi:DNA polymerase III subunit epsilon